MFVHKQTVTQLTYKASVTHHKSKRQYCLVSQRTLPHIITTITASSTQYSKLPGPQSLNQRQHGWFSSRNSK